MLIPTGFAQVNYRFGGAAFPNGAEVTLGLGVAGYAGSAAECAEDCYRAWEASFLSVQAPTLSLLSALVKFGPTATGPSAEFAEVSDGLNAGNPEAPQVAVLVQKVTALGGRAGRGRFFVPGVIESGTETGGTLSAPTLAAYQDEANDFFDELEERLLLPVVLHGENSPIGTPTPITSFQVQARTATQRRRNRR